MFRRPERFKELFKAVDENSHHRVEQMLNSPEYTPIINTIITECGNGSPLLTHALNKGYSRIARLLVRAGADVNLGNDGSDRTKYSFLTPLVCAITREIEGRCPSHRRIIAEVRVGDLDATPALIELLIQRGANPNQNSGEHTPLKQLFAKWKDSTPEDLRICRDIFRILVNAGANEASLLGDEEWINKFREEMHFLQQPAAILHQFQNPIEEQAEQQANVGTVKRNRIGS